MTLLAALVPEKSAGTAGGGKFAVVTVTTEDHADAPLLFFALIYAR